MGASTAGNFGKTKGTKSKPSHNDRFRGKPGEIKKQGKTETKIGKDGRAIRERHHTDHGYPKYHTNPHDHKIKWDKNGNPSFGDPINYWEKSTPKFK